MNNEFEDVFHYSLSASPRRCVVNISDFLLASSATFDLLGNKSKPLSMMRKPFNFHFQRQQSHMNGLEGHPKELQQKA